MNPFKFKNRKSKYIFVAVLVLAVILIVLGIVNTRKKETKVVEVAGAKEVKTMVLGASDENKNFIETTGIVKPESKVEIVALVSGTVRNIYFTVGDRVQQNQLLAGIYDSAILSSFNTAQAGYNNLQQNFLATKRTAEETVKQAETGLKSAQESVKLAEVALVAAQSNYDNTKELLSSNNLSAKVTAVTSFYDYLNTSNNALRQVDNILAVDNNTQSANTNKTLGALDHQSLEDAKLTYLSASEEYKKASLIVADKEKINSDINEAVIVLNKVVRAVDATIKVLDNTLSSTSFPQSSLDAQKSGFNTLRGIVNGNLLSAQNLSAGLNNLEIQNRQQLDNLSAALDNAKNQLALAKLGSNSAETAYQSARLASEQQIIGAQTNLDNARGQLNLIGTQVGDLSVKTPIEGEITQKLVEVGSQVAPGQKLAEVVSSNAVKILVDLSSGDVYKINLGDEAIINNEIKGVVSNINPSADAVTKKVQIQIVADNSEGKLIPETFVDVAIKHEPLKATEETKNIDNIILVPLRAVMITQTERFVFVNEGGVAKRVEVTLGNLVGDQIEVKSGLVGNEELIVDGVKDLENGDQINIQ